MADSTLFRGVTLGRCVELLELLCDSRSGLTVDELAERLRVNRRSVFRYIASLEASGLVEADRPHKKHGVRYRNGERLRELARRTQGSHVGEREG